ncbi:hypothetical protein T01_2638 [Trichinella spiralis]|uniref:Uncharacterized protein n=1 Tax=Trichinella spiralis TaxID=6334 RepID=A0A0V1BYM1_TRISP|nr:hypothetical protein T01_2638 [Trichinella spiralis]
MQQELLVAHLSPKHLRDSRRRSELGTLCALATFSKMTFSTVVDPCKDVGGSRADGGDCVQSSASGRNKLNPKGWSEVNNL